MVGKNNVVVKKLANSFWVKIENNVVLCKVRGDNKKTGVFVGDHVEVIVQDNEHIIKSVKKRTNLLVRPPLANLDQLIIVVAVVPKPDFSIVDKLIVFALSYGIKPIIVVNKIDVSDDVFSYTKNCYKNVCQVIALSAKQKTNLSKLKQLLKNNLSAFAGQSAVGKSALINSIFKTEISKEGELSKKIERGKNTTRHTEIFFDNDCMIADTAGFTSLDEKLLPLAYFELASYYPDYVAYKPKCKFTSCAHIHERVSDCAVKQAVQKNELDKERHNRYVKIYEILKKEWERTHG